LNNSNLDKNNRIEKVIRNPHKVVDPNYIYLTDLSEGQDDLWVTYI